MTDIQQYNEKIFEKIKHINAYNQESWYGRELAEVLEYTKWGNFKRVVEKAKIACENSGFNSLDHFADIGKMVKLGSGAERSIDDIMLSRYACYLIVQNADSRKKVVALGQTYFAQKTRQQELSENFEQLTEDRKRLAIRNELKEHNKKLVDAAKDAGVESQHILDHMGSTELAANLFRATQTEEKLRRDNVKGKDNANRTHYEVGAKVRKTIKDLGGTMPEDLPTPDKSVKIIEREEQKKLK